MSEIQAISGTRRSFKEMADGTIRVSIDIDPRFRKEFFASFGEIDMPVALAPLLADFETRAPAEEKPKGGALAKLTGLWRNDPKFWEWCRSLKWSCYTEEDAAAMIRTVCGVESCAELDHDEAAEAIFHREIRIPFSKWLQFGQKAGGAA
jgi:hypothetical protein